jgi:hypothetical protein
MAKETIKSLQFWYMAEVPIPGGQTAMVEKIANRGDEVDITDAYDQQRGEEQDAFMSAEEKKAFAAEGTPYDTEPYEDTGAPPEPAAGLNWAEATPEDMADYMEENSMTVNDVLEVANAHPDRLNDILEAENILTSDEPRKGVTEGIEKIAKAQSE